MKILHMNPAFYPAFAYGGTVNVSYNLCKELVKRGHDVTVYTSDTIDEHKRHLQRYSIQEGIKIHYFKNLSNSLAWRRFFFYPGLIIALKNNIQRFDVIHLHDLRNFQNIVAVYYAKKFGKPYVLQAHGALPHLSHRGMMKEVFDRLFGKNILDNLSKALALNQTEYEQYVSMGVPRERIVIFPNGLNRSEPIPRSRGEFKKKNGIDPNERIILYVGRIHKTKGLDILLRAFAIVNKTEKDTLLVLIGPDDDFKDELDRLAERLKIQDRIRFLGFVSSHDKYAAYADSEVFATPKYSGFPITFLEACASGLPIVTTTAGDTLEWIHDNVGLVAENDEEQIAASLIRILSDPSLRKRYGERGKALVTDEFNWDSIVERLEDIYSDVISEVK